MAISFIPNPCSPAPEVLAAQAKPPESGSNITVDEICERLKEVFFNGAEQISLFSCSRQGLYQVVFSGFIYKKALICINGPVSQEWYDIGKYTGVDMSVLDTAYGQPFSLKALRELLEKETFDAILIVDTDIYTGASARVKELSEISRAIQPDALIIVDCSGSISCTMLYSIEKTVDVYICCSEIALGLPPGLGIVAAGNRAHMKAVSRNGFGWYFNYSLQFVMHHEYGLNPILPYQLINALSVQMDSILLEGIEERILRTLQTGEKFRAWAMLHGLEIIAAESIRVPNITVLRCLQQFSPEDLDMYLRQYGLYIGRSYGELKNNTFVVSHMNTIHEVDIELLIQTLERFLEDYDTRNVQSPFIFFHRRAKPDIGLPGI